MRLRDLEPKLLKMPVGNVWSPAESLAEAKGIQFLCPRCFEKNGGPVGTHGVVCWFVGVPGDIPPGPGRWTPSGTGIDDLTFVPGTPPRMCSVQLTGPGCGAHFHITRGGIEPA